jgi:predicted SAM-dependent methyltransferase
MSLRGTLKQSEAIVGVVRDTRKILGALRNSNLGVNGRLINRYLSSHDVRKLQVGSGTTLLDGWLSTDINPRTDETAYLDATSRFPFEDETFHYVYSEHMIEHIPWKDALFMLRECCRVLKRGGTIRVATPDLKVLLDLYAGADGPLKERYVRWITDNFLEDVDVYKPAFVINNAFHNWGHQFLFDADLLAMALRRAGFEDIRQVRTGDSEDPHLRGIESHGKNIDADDMAMFETMVFEARRPDRLSM